MSQANSISTKTGIDRRVAIIDIAKPYRFERTTNDINLTKSERSDDSLPRISPPFRNYPKRISIINSRITGPNVRIANSR